MGNKNNFNGETNFNGPTQIVAGNVINNQSNSYEKKQIIIQNQYGEVLSLWLCYRGLAWLLE